jgi:hypothetical protein
MSAQEQQNWKSQSNQITTFQAELIEFIPATDVERNIPRETEFRETAVKIVDQVGFFEIPDFPKPPANQVTFDIDLKRTVNGPTGVSIVGVPAK